MKSDEFYNHHLFDDSIAIQVRYNPYYPRIQCGLDDPVIIEGKSFINLASNNYLGLANDSRVVEAAIKGINEYGVSMCGTPIASGYSELFKQTEQSLAAFTGLEDSVIFPSCYQANNGLFRAIAGQDDLIIFDRFGHSSLVEGIISSGSKYRPFRHNDLGHLEDILKKSEGYSQRFVVTESVFSTEGAIAPIKEINRLCEKYGAIAVIDDSHGIGVLGVSGRGILEYSDIRDFQGIYTASLGKAMVSTGGMIGGKKSLIQYLRYRISSLIYSTALMPAALKALLEVIRIINEEYPVISARLHKYTAQIRKALTMSEYSLTNSDAPINSICSGNSVETIVLSKKLYGEGILTTPFIFPSVPENEGRIRIIAAANLYPESIEYVVNSFKLLKIPPNENSTDHKSTLKRG